MRVGETEPSQHSPGGMDLRVMPGDQGSDAMGRCSCDHRLRCLEGVSLPPSVSAQLNSKLQDGSSHIPRLKPAASNVITRAEPE